MNRGTLGFKVEFEDGTVMEKTYSDIKRTVALADLIKRHKELLPLTAETLKAQAELKRRVKMTILQKKILFIGYIGYFDILYLDI